METAKAVNPLETLSNSLTALLECARPAQLAIHGEQGAAVEIEQLACEVTELVRQARTEALPRTSGGSKAGHTVMREIDEFQSVADDVRNHAARVLHTAKVTCERKLGVILSVDPKDHSWECVQRREGESYVMYAHLDVINAFTHMVQAIANQCVAFVVAARVPDNRACEKS